MRSEFWRGFLLALGCLIGGGCKAADKQASPFPEIDPAPSSATLLAGPPPPARPFKERMKEHAVLGVNMREAVIRGDLESARRAAHALAELPVESALPAPRRSRLDAMVLAAQHARAARDLREAAQSLAALGGTCGACHTAFGGPRTPLAAAPAAPPDEPDRETHMLRHQWGAVRLWEGLAAPSDEAWQSGAHVLADAPFPAERLTPGKTPVAAIERLTSTVHELGRKARTVEDSAGRVAIYGEVMATCATCHEWLGGGARARSK